MAQVTNSKFCQTHIYGQIEDQAERPNRCWATVDIFNRSHGTVQTYIEGTKDKMHRSNLVQIWCH